jgi:IS605 OrfB family transposase
MITIKLPYTASSNFTALRKQFSSTVRWSYTRFKEGKSEKEIRSFFKNLQHTDLLDVWTANCAISEGKYVYTQNKDQKVIFGGKINFYSLLKGKLSKEEWSAKRLLPLGIQGEKAEHGNRKFKMDVVENNQLIFKLNRKEHFVLTLPNLRKNIRQQLFKLQELNENEGHTYSIKLDEKYVHISFKEFKNESPIETNKNRYVGIDLNPDAIGVSIFEGKTLLEAKEFSLKMISNKFISSKLSSDSPKAKYYQNKLKFETLEISKAIAKMATQHRCAHIFIEDLNFKQKVKNKYNNVGNRKCKNLWKRELFVQNLRKRAGVVGIHLSEVNPAYSSFVGNLQHDYTDAVNASMEIARRGYEFKILNNKNGFYPKFNLKNSFQHQWKETGIELVEDWKKFYLLVKNAKLRYRVFLDEVKIPFRVFRMSSPKSGIFLYDFV